MERPPRGHGLEPGGGIFSPPLIFLRARNGGCSWKGLLVVMGSKPGGGFFFSPRMIFFRYIPRTPVEGILNFSPFFRLKCFGPFRSGSARARNSKQKRR